MHPAILRYTVEIHFYKKSFQQLDRFFPPQRHLAADNANNIDLFIELVDSRFN